MQLVHMQLTPVSRQRSCIADLLSLSQELFVTESRVVIPRQALFMTTFQPTSFHKTLLVQAARLETAFK